MTHYGRPARTDRRKLTGLYRNAVRQLADKMIREGVDPEIAKREAPGLLALGTLRRLELVR